MNASCAWGWIVPADEPEDSTNGFIKRPLDPDVLTGTITGVFEDDGEAAAPVGVPELVETGRIGAELDVPETELPEDESEGDDAPANATGAAGATAPEPPCDEPPEPPPFAGVEGTDELTVITFDFGNQAVIGTDDEPEIAGNASESPATDAATPLP